MKTFLSSVAFLLYLYSTSSLAQQATPSLSPRAYFVSQCSLAARTSAMMADTYPKDEEKRSNSFGMIVKAMVSDQNPRAPTLKQFNTAFIVMEMLVKTRPSQSQESLKEEIIAEAAATCMAASLEQ